MSPLLSESDGQVPALRVAPEAAGGTFVCARARVTSGQDGIRGCGRHGGEPR